jgi:hypothetical protein
LRDSTRLPLSRDWPPMIDATVRVSAMLMAD